MRAKQHPYRLLVLLLYGRYSWATWRGHVVTAEARALCRTFRVSRSRLQEYFTYLRVNGFLDFVTWSPDNTTVTARIVPPRVLRQQKDDNESGMI